MSANGSESSGAEAVMSVSARLRRTALLLSLANALELSGQVVVPMVLVRLLDAADFGLYRTLWLIAITSGGALALGVPASLYYYLPRSTPAQAATYMLQSAVYMLIAGTVASLGTAAFVMSHETGAAIGWGAVPFVGLWVFASLLDFVFNAQQIALTQARVNLSFTLLRVTLVLAAAFLYRSWTGVVIALLVAIAVKAVFCAITVVRFAQQSAHPTVSSIAEHGRYCLPIGISTALYLLRSKIDQWLVASLFNVAQFGAYSIASVFTPIQTLIRLAVNQVVLPEMNRLQAQEHRTDMLILNNRANVAVAFLMFPTVAFIATWVEPLLTVLFTHRYSDVAPIVRLYLLISLIESIDISAILIAMRQGRFMMLVDSLVLPIAIAATALGATLFGLPGAVSGPLLGALISQSALYARCHKLTGVRGSQLQEWRSLMLIAAASVLAAIASQFSNLPFLPDKLLFKLMTSAVLFTTFYWVSLKVLGATMLVRKVFGQRIAAIAGF